MAHVESYLNASLGLARVGVRKMASCVAECDCARSYAIGGAMVWAIAIQAAMRTGKEPLPKTEKASLPVPQIPAGKVAGKAA